MQAKGHTVLITGGGSGIGLALARQFVQAGNRVVLVGRSAERLESARKDLRAEIQSGNPGALEAVRTHVADLRDAASAFALSEAFPDVNVLVNNAGVQHNYDLREIAASDFAQQAEQELRVNLLAPAQLCRAFLPQLIRHAQTATGKSPAAAIINISSGLALAPKSSAPVYCASKAGLHSFTQSLRAQLRSDGVAVFEVLAPLVDTAMTAGRGSGKISPADLAGEFWRGWRRDRFEIFAGKTKLLRFLLRLVPSLARSLMLRL